MYHFYLNILVIFLCVLLHRYKNVISKVNAESEDSYYRAAVVEVVPFSDPALAPMEVVQRTLAVYEKAVDIAKSNDADIIVFPETVLFMNGKNHAHNRTALIGSMAVDVPDPQQEDYNPCLQENKFRVPYLLEKLSCLAKEGKIFLVANLIDYKRCNNFCEILDENDSSPNCQGDDSCPEDGLYFYNTNVVFNREGKLVVRYHKKHLFFEPLFHPSETTDHAHFETDFGNFTTFVCFDMLPGTAVEAIETTRVNNLAFPYFWHNHTPLLYFSPAFQQSFASLNRINVLAANGHLLGRGTLGSGIFSSTNGALIYTYNPDERSKLLISNVPKDPKIDIALNFDDLNRKRYTFHGEEFVEDKIEENPELENECETKVLGLSNDTLKSHQCYSMNLTTYTFVKLKDSEGTISACSNNFCCSVSYKANSMDESYFLAVSGEPFPLYDLHIYSIESCFFTRCHSEDGYTCANFVLKSKTMFETVDLRGNFTSKYIYPLSMDSKLRLTDKEEWTFDGKSHLNYTNLKNSSLLFLSLHGRNYFQDLLNLGENNN